jgi:hypothetical protein
MLANPAGGVACGDILRAKLELIPRSWNSPEAIVTKSYVLSRGVLAR